MRQNFNPVIKLNQLYQKLNWGNISKSYKNCYINYLMFNTFICKPETAGGVPA